MSDRIINISILQCPIHLTDKKFPFLQSDFSLTSYCEIQLRVRFHCVGACLQSCRYNV